MRCRVGVAEQPVSRGYGGQTVAAGGHRPAPGLH